MKIALWIALAICVTSVTMSAPASAAVNFASTYYYFSGDQLVGQAAIQCNNYGWHWGDASRYNLANTVEVTYKCPAFTNPGVQHYGTGINDTVRQSFCTIASTGCYGSGPMHEPGYPPAVDGLYSD